MKSRFDDMIYVIMPVDLIRTLRRFVVELCTVMC